MNSMIALRAAADALRRRQFAEAQANAEQGLAIAPDDPALLGIMALALLQQDRKEQAIPFLRRQLAINPGDRATRFNLAMALLGSGQGAEAETLAQDHAGHVGLARLAGYFAQERGDPQAAASAYRAAVEAAPQDWESWNNLGNCLAQLEDRDGAILAFENAINASPYPSLPEIFLNLSQSLTAVSQRDARLRNAEEAAQRFPENHAIQVELGLAQAASGRAQEARATLEAAAAREDHFGEARMELGLLLEAGNHLEALDALIAECEAIDPRPELSFLKAWSLRRKDRFAEARAEADRIPETVNPIRTAQVRAEIAERLGESEEAFRQFTLMNEASRAAHPRAAGPSYRETVEAQTAAMSAALPPIATEPGSPPDPIFIVGSPRSGTTLLDTLLMALPELQVFEEQTMLAAVEAEFPGVAAETDPARVQAARRRYFELAADLEGPLAGRRLVDKMPLHMTRMPTIQRLFPDAKIVLVERHPCDAVLSCFMANFAPNQAMQSYTDLEEAARTYAAIFASFERANDLLAIKVHRVRYERMIADLEAEMRPLLEFLGLEWRDSVLDNQATAAKRGAVRTASYAQIGQPLYKRAVGRWERYRPQLEPVMPVLRPWIEKLGYES